MRMRITYIQPFFGVDWSMASQMVTSIRSIIVFQYPESSVPWHRTSGRLLGLQMKWLKNSAISGPNIGSTRSTRTFVEKPFK